MVKKLRDWLENPKRKYSEGVEIFKAVASKKQLLDFSAFFQKGLEKEDIGQFDIHATTLVNQLTFSQTRLKHNKEEFERVSAIVVGGSLDSSAHFNNEASKTDKSAELGKKVDTGTYKQGAGDGPNDIKPVKLPPELEARLKEIIPIMAKVHAEMANETLADDKRALLRKELITLDNERRAIWDRIDFYNENVAPVDIKKSESEEEIEQNMFKLGADVKTRIDQLKLNIKRNTDSLEKYKKAKDEEKMKTSTERINMYMTELAELEGLFDEPKV